jgi:hypothetical protein
MKILLAASIQSEQRDKGRKIKTLDVIIIVTAFTANLLFIVVNPDSYALLDYTDNLLPDFVAKKPDISVHHFER